MASKCLVCNHQHSAKKADALSCGVCKMCGAVLTSKRVTVRSAGKIYAVCCTTCKGTYQRIYSLMKRKLRKGEITQKEFQDFENNIAI